MDPTSTNLSGVPNSPERGQGDDSRGPYNLSTPTASDSPSWSFEAISVPQSSRQRSAPSAARPNTLGPQNPTAETALTSVHREADRRRDHHIRRRLANRPDHFVDNNTEAGPSRRQRRAIANPFGTREEIESEGYQSPVADLFGRAWNRYREAQEATRAARTRAEDERRTAGDVGVLGTGPPPFHGVDLDTAMAQHRLEDSTDERELMMAFGASLRQRQRDHPHAHPRVNPIDQQSSRPPPLETQQMTISIACKICCEQKVDTLLEPCMHVAICHWCSELIRDRARRRRRQRLPGMDDEGRWRCPICRHDVTQSRRVYLA